MKIDNFKISWLATADLTPNPSNARTHSARQIRQIADSIGRFGFTNPVLVGDDGTLLAGHGRVEAAKLLQMKSVPTIKLSHLTAEERRAYVIADNKLAASAGWDLDILTIELGALAELEFDLSLTGFSTGEIDILLDGVTSPADGYGVDVHPPSTDHAVCRPGDLWKLGRHRLLCADTLKPASLETLMDGQIADILFTDPPYNVPIAGHVSGLGNVRHREFAMASGEMSREKFTAFLSEALAGASVYLRDGAIAYVCMDWRHVGEMLAAGEAAFDELKNICVWNKSNGGMGAFYRSKHEFIYVFKQGTAPHINNFGLGEHGRYRTNVWEYPGINSFGENRDEELAMHPTVKPVALIADALKDCSNRNGIVLDLFGGSGSTLIAAQTTGRSARLVEIDPLYCDTTIRRFIQVTGEQPTDATTGRTFDEVQSARLEGELT